MKGRDFIGLVGGAAAWPYRGAGAAIRTHPDRRRILGLKAAKALDLNSPPSLLARADDVIE
jgi:hypothetical protein